MRSRVTIFVTIALVLMLLVLLNAASYVRLEQEADSEFAPDRSSLNAGATGTRALYDFLQESGYRVTRWRKSPAALSGGEVVQPSTFVVIGDVRREIEKEEAESLLRWVGRGGRLVLVDRSPNLALLPASGGWRVALEVTQTPDLTTRPSDVETMTQGVKPLAPTQPTLLTRDVTQVVYSRFASRLHAYPFEERADEAQPASPPPPPKPIRTPPVGVGQRRASEASQDEQAAHDEEATRGEAATAPVEHLADNRTGDGALLLDYAYRRGHIIILSDPFIISNSGLSRADNLPLAVNILTAGGGGVIAFDEFHQGRGATENMTFAYFRGTPVLAMFAQFAVVLLAVVWTRSRRFARPLPAPHVDRRSKLEFVASMAELQQRARAYDLAIENVYGRTRRALARYGGAAQTASCEEIAARVAARSGRDAGELAALMRQCEDAIAGEPISGARALRLVARLREVERELGIRMRAREIRQARAL